MSKPIEIAGPIDWPDPGQIPAIQPVHDLVVVWRIDLDHGIDPADDTTEPGDDLTVLSADERTRAARFVRARDRRRFARCRASLRQILGECLGRDPASLAFAAGGHGKPLLAPEPGGTTHATRFNVSHSAGLALIAVGQDHELGVDLERIRPITEMDRIIENYFTPDEFASFRALTETQRAMTFARGWTRKEAIMKARGVGLAGLSSGAATGFGEGSLMPRFTPSGMVVGFAIWEAAVAPGFVAALAVEAATM